MSTQRRKLPAVVGFALGALLVGASWLGSSSPSVRLAVPLVPTQLLADRLLRPYSLPLARSTPAQARSPLAPTPSFRLGTRANLSHSPRRIPTFPSASLTTRPSAIRSTCSSHGSTRGAAPRQRRALRRPTTRRTSTGSTRASGPTASTCRSTAQRGSSRMCRQRTSAIATTCSASGCRMLAGCG